mmetsp:Transcript_13853/g.37635  ORF Transcript_13853/g.37635 Transcript_13853/m.37635 type:complete len:222 (-) Transcript_13853:10-675(-)
MRDDGDVTDKENRRPRHSNSSGTEVLHEVRGDLDAAHRPVSSVSQREDQRRQATTQHHHTQWPKAVGAPRLRREVSQRLFRQGERGLEVFFVVEVLPPNFAMCTRDAWVTTDIPLEEYFSVMDLPPLLRHLCGLPRLFCIFLLHLLVLDFLYVESRLIVCQQWQDVIIWRGNKSQRPRGHPCNEKPESPMSELVTKATRCHDTEAHGVPHITWHALGWPNA